MSTTGKVVQVIGPVVDIEFPLDEKLPEINTALKIQEADDKTLTVEVALELGDGVVRTIAMDGTDGLKRGWLSKTPTPPSVYQWVTTPSVGSLTS